nr:hypothetical protein [Tanacetum cinerariifolium]
MHNNIMAAGSRDRPYTPTTVVVPAVPTTNDSPAVPKHTTIETPISMSAKNKAHYESEKEAIHLILTGIGDEIYSTVDSCKTAHEMKPKRVKDSTYQKKKMLLCKQAEKATWQKSKRFLQLTQELILSLWNSNTCLVEKDDSDVTPDSPDMCEHDIQTDQNAEDERDALANLIANLKFNVDENKKIQKQLKKENTSLAYELEQCKSILAETSKTLEESNSVWDSCLVVLQTKLTGFEKYKACNDRTVEYDKLECKLNETLGLLAQKDIDLKEGLKFKAYEISVVKEKHDELVKQSLLTKSHYKGLVKEKIKLAHANEVRKKMWRKSFVKVKPNIFKNIDFLPVSKSISKSRQAYNVMTSHINHFEEIDDQAWVKHSMDHISLRPPTAHDIQILIKTCLMPLALKTQNDSLAFVHELKQEIHADLKYVESLEKEIDDLESDKAEFSNMYDTILQEYLKAQLQDKNIAISELKKLIEKCKGKSVETKFDKPYVVRQPNDQRIPKPSVLGKPTPFSDSLKRKSFSQTKLVPKTNVSDSLSKPVTTQILHQTAKQVVSNTKVIKPCIPKHRSTQMKDKVMPNNSQVKLKKTEVEDHHSISSISNKTTSETACNDSLKSRTLNVNAVCATCDSGCTKYMMDNLKLLCNFIEKYLGTVRFGNDQFAPILGYGDLVQGNMTINKGNDLLIGNRGSDLYTISLQEITSSTPLCLMAKASPTQARLWHRRISHLNFDYINLLSKKDFVIDKIVPSQKELDLLFGPLYDEFFNACISSVNRSSSPTDNSKHQDKPPIMNIQSSTQPSNPSNANAKENNNIQAEHEFINPFCTPVHKVDESSSHNIAEPKNIKEAMADSARIIVMQEEFISLTDSKSRNSLTNPMASTTSDPPIPMQYLYQSGQVRLEILKKHGLWNPKGSSFELTAFSDVDHVRCIDTRKSTSRGIHFLGDKLVSWMSKNRIALQCHQQRLNTWRYLQVMLKTEYQLANMFTKALPVDRFKYLVKRIGMRCLTPAELEVLANEST